jgi:predicted CXXCH cytochrome family protein
LVRPVSDICSQCHERLVVQDQTVVHEPFADGQCTACHTPHGSGVGRRLNRPPGPLCLSCHDEVTDSLESGKYRHKPALDGDCLSCHRGHSSKTPGLLIAPGGKVCKTCHAKGKIGNHRGVDSTNADCSGCHAPHAADTKALLLPVLHGPFKEGACSDCHK